MATTQDLSWPRAGRGWSRSIGQLGIGFAAALLTVGTAIGAKELQSRAPVVPPMAAVSSPEPARPLPLMGEPTEPAVILASAEEAPSPEDLITPELLDYALDPTVRWFNGRPVRPAKTVTMTVTGYSPDERSCGDSADGKTATLHSVKTNNMKLVAADPKVLPYGSMLSIPGYAEMQVVPVLDCGGAIKGNKLDLLFPTHEEAMQWGRKKVRVTVWQYADGKPAENPRKLR